MFCSQCGNANDISSKYCSSCGAALPHAVQNSPPPRIATSTPDNREEFYRAALGPNNQDYYLRHFSRFDSNGKASATWHWPAFFVTFYWLLYRKMWLNALLYFFLPYLVMIPFWLVAAVYENSSDAMIGMGYILYFLGIILLPPMYANALYYKHCRKIISEIRSSSHDMERQLGELSGKGGTSNVALIVVLVFAFISIIGILAAIAIPSYQDYTTRTRLAEATTVGKNATDSVANYYYQHQQIPSSLAVAGFVTPLPTSIRAIGVDSQSGTVTITMATSPIEGKTLLFVPSLDANNLIVWKCLSQEIQDKYLPLQCQQQK